jgi:hypothetical protein
MHLLGKASNNEEKERYSQLFIIKLKIFTYFRMINRLVDVYGLTLNTAEITNDTTAKRGPYLARLLIIDQLLKNRYLTKSDLESHALGCF